ncbi:PTR2 domain-containing protein [Cephalotus follicularis]|uniref:PTR2 domain-containing protein n=1 Tax=Cephalotus follicularis TaxID=3775 RepID=A0A1Q3BKU2_CEPFO|nr:PTR2 domain-containing protein [Cephalotus follicularis]
MASFVRVTALIWADIVAWYAVWVMMTYLTNVWKLEVTHAAAIVNVFMGAAIIMPIGMAFMVDTFMGDYSMLLLSSLAYSFGMSFLAMSTPPVLAEAVGTCSAYEPDCIGNTQKVLFYTALALIAVGVAGHVTSLVSFINHQIETVDKDFHSKWKLPFQFGAFIVVILLSIIGGIALPYIKPWSTRFGIPAIFTVLATVLFLSGSCSYNYVSPQGRSLTTVFRVFVASASKILCGLPKDANNLYGSCRLDVDTLPHTQSLRCLDKAAIIVPTETLENQEQNRWKLCSVTEVEETKISLRMIPILITLIMCGVVSSVGATYFLEQANHMNRKLQKWRPEG